MPDRQHRTTASNRGDHHAASRCSQWCGRRRPGQPPRSLPGPPRHRRCSACCSSDTSGRDRCLDSRPAHLPDCPHLRPCPPTGQKRRARRPYPASHTGSRQPLRHLLDVPIRAGYREYFSDHRAPLTRAMHLDRYRSSHQPDWARRP